MRDGERRGYSDWEGEREVERERGRGREREREREGKGGREGGRELRD